MSNDSNRSDPETVRQPSHTDSHAPNGDICSDHDSFGDNAKQNHQTSNKETLILHQYKCKAF